MKIGERLRIIRQERKVKANDIAELLYSSYNRDDSNYINFKEAINSGFHRLYSTSEDAITKKNKMLFETIKKDGVYYMLEGVEDPYNFGYAVRSIYAAGGDGIILTPRNWMGVAGVVARSSAGSSEIIDMRVCEAENAVDIFKSAGYTVICAGIRDSESIFEASLKKPLFVVLGGEKRGISRSVLDKADKVVRIDYGNDFNGSLSTAAATAVFAFEVLRNNIAE